MFKKVVSVILVLTILVGCFSVAVSARQLGVGSGAESFNPVEFRQEKDIIGVTTVEANFVATITDTDYKVRIESIGVELPFLEEGDTSNLTVSYQADQIVEGTTKFPVTGHISEDTNSVVRYTIKYDILDKNGDTVWKNLTGYAYGIASGTEEKTGAIGTEPGNPGDLDDGARFTSIDKLNSCYVQVPSAALLYTLKTQHFFITFSTRTSVTQVISGNAPDTMRFYDVYWPTVQWYRQDAEGTWLMWSIPDSGYYNFTVDMNYTNVKWDDESNTILSTEMYYLDSFDKQSAKTYADRMLGINGMFEDGCYVQEGRYTAESWSNFVSALDMAYQVGLAVAGPNYGFRVACENGKDADQILMSAFSNLQEAPCIWDMYKDDVSKWGTYKDPIIGESATCGSSGSVTYTCICGKTKTVVGDASACIPSDEWVVTIPPTCTTKGEEAQHCTRCGNPVITRVLDELGHEYETEVVPPTCLEQGYTIHSCIRGDHTYNDEFTPAKGHTPGRPEYIYPTAIVDGVRYIHCADCDVVISSHIMPKPVGNFIMSAQSNGNTFFTAVADSDFKLNFSVPKNSIVNTSGVTTSLSVSDMPSFGIEDEVTYQSTVKSESGEEIAFGDYLSGFKNAKLSGTVSTKDSTSNVVYKNFNYNITAANTTELYAMNAVPENNEDVSAAFSEFVSHIKSEKIEKYEEDFPEDEDERNRITNHIKLPGTAYIQIGTDKLTFENPDEIYTFSKVEEKPEFKFEKAEAIEDGLIEIYIPVGSIFAIGNHRMTFNDFLTIGISGYSDNENVDNFISNLESCQTSDEVVEEFTLFFAEFIGSLNGQEIILNLAFDPAGYTISGTVESFLCFEGASGKESATVDLKQDGQSVQRIKVSGVGVNEFNFESIPSGTYQVVVKKRNHVTREYELVINNKEISDLEYKIHLVGDIDGNGKANVLDYTSVLRHVKKTKFLDGYELSCADTDLNGKVNILDYTAILRHVKKTESLW